MFDSTETDFAGALEWLTERIGQDVLVLINGPEADSPTLLRVTGPLGPLESIDDGLVSSRGVVATASFAVGPATVSMYGPEFVRAEMFSDSDWLIVRQQHAEFEWRIAD